MTNLVLNASSEIENMICFLINIFSLSFIFQVKNAIVSEEFVTWDLSIHDRIGRASQPAPDVEFIEETNRHGDPDNKLTLHYCHYRSTLFL